MSTTPTTPSPATVYGTPKRLAQTQSLSMTDRRRLLEEWEDDIRAELVASEEGMTGPARVTLEDVLAAKEKLPIATPARPSDSKA